LKFVSEAINHKSKKNQKKNQKQIKTNSKTNYPKLNQPKQSQKK